jgi:hypothetical protein
MSLQPKLGQRGQIRVVGQVAVVLERQQSQLLVGDQDRSAIGEEVEAQGQRLVPDDQLGCAVVVDRLDLARDPITEPEPAVVPSRRLHKSEAGSEDVDLGGRHRGTRVIVVARAPGPLMARTSSSSPRYFDA